MDNQGKGINTQRILAMPFKEYLSHIVNRLEDELTSEWLVEIRDCHAFHDMKLYISNDFMNWRYTYKVDRIEQMYEWMTAEEAYLHIKEDLGCQFMKLLWEENIG